MAAEQLGVGRLGLRHPPRARQRRAGLARHGSARSVQDDVVDVRLELIGPPLGGSLVNQISTYRPDAELLVWNVWVPEPTSFCLATLVNEARPPGETLVLLPDLDLTLAPAAGPNVTCTD